MPIIFHHRVDLASAHTTFIVAALTAAGDLLLAPPTILISSCTRMSTLVSMSKKSLSIRLEPKSSSHSPHSHFLNFRVESGAQHTCQGFLHRCEGSATSSGSLWLPGELKERAFPSSTRSSPLPLPNQGWIRATLFERQENEQSQQGRRGEGNLHLATRDSENETYRHFITFLESYFII